MAKYRTKREWLQTIKPEDGGRPFVILHPANTEVEYDGLPADNLEPLDATAKRKRNEAEENRERTRREADLKASKEGQSILAALITALKGEGADLVPHKAEQKAPEYDADEGPKIKMPSPAKISGPTAGRR